MSEGKIIRVFPRRTNATPDDELAFTRPLMLGDEFDDISEVHISVAFTWDMQTAEDLEFSWRGLGVPVKMGGPAFGERMSPEFVAGRYVKKGFTITSRGCPNHCWFCEVGKRAQGRIIELPIEPGWNILDDNLLATSDKHFYSVMEMLKTQPPPAFTGGLEAKILTEDRAEAIMALKPQRMFFAYDTPDDLEPLIDAGRTLQRVGLPQNSHRALCYVLCGYPKDTMEAAETRMWQTIEAGFMPFAMVYRDNLGKRNPAWITFQREWANHFIVGTKMNEYWRTHK